MSYRALYRVWRPQRFDELVGQSVIAKTLENTIKLQHISHAYLFTGPRGTGKTSTAKILAKAVNCPYAKNGEPCNHCKICKAITNGSLNDVIEVDAASNNGVDEIRNIRDKATYAPTQAKYKVYIIDEVHMLSEGAFNALLKTLEEPPKHVIFILATTELNKVPATIISRTQHFTFQRIHPQAILDRMEYILKQEHIKYDVRALQIISKVAEGGMRDALSILDEALSFGNDRVSYKVAMQVTGCVSHQLMEDYIANILHHKTAPALTEVRKLLDNGKSADQFIEELMKYYQSILLYKQSSKLLNTNKSLMDQKFITLTKDISEPLIYEMIKNINGTEMQMRYTSHPDIYLEALTVQLANMNNQKNDEVTKLKSEVDQLKNAFNNLKSTSMSNNSEQSNSTNTTISDTKNITMNTGLNHILNHATRNALQFMRTCWQSILSQLPKTQAISMRSTIPEAASHTGVVIAFKSKLFADQVLHDKNDMINLTNAIQGATGVKTNIIITTVEHWLAIRHTFYMQQRNG